jgi:hypothetical protein
MKNGGTGTAETTIIRGVFAAIELELIVEGHFRPERESLTKKTDAFNFLYASDDAGLDKLHQI